MSGGFATYTMHGLLVRSDLTLEEPTVDTESCDVEVRWGSSRVVPTEPPPGEGIVRLVAHDRTWYSASRHDHGYMLRFPELCDFDISLDCRSVTCHAQPGVDPDLVPILVRGTLVSLLLSLRGHHVLHASAVSIGGEAIAFAGASGMGKSTSAALLCASGGQLVSDDVVRVRVNPARCFVGASAIRLKPTAFSIVDMFEVRPKTQETADGRLAISPPHAAEDQPLNAIVVPYPRRDISTIEVEPVNGSEAFWLLSHFGRLVGWQQQEFLQRQFTQVGELVRQVPVLKANLPWGPPFSKDLATDLREALDPYLGRGG